MKRQFLNGAIVIVGLSGNILNATAADCLPDDKACNGIIQSYIEDNAKIENKITTTNAEIAKLSLSCNATPPSESACKDLKSKQKDLAKLQEKQKTLEEKKNEKLARYSAEGVDIHTEKKTDGSVDKKEEAHFLKFKTTQIVNLSLQGSNQLNDSLSVNNQNKKNQEELSKLSNGATQRDALEAKANLADNSESLNKRKATAEGTAAVVQGAFAVKHFAESERAAKLMRSENEKLTAIQNEMKALDNEELPKQKSLLDKQREAAVSTGQDTTSIDNDIQIVQEKMAKLEKLKESESKVQLSVSDLSMKIQQQEEYGLLQAATAAQTATKAQQAMNEASSARRYADELRIQAQTLNQEGGTPTFNFNPNGPGTVQQDLGNPVGPAVETAAVEAGNGPSGELDPGSLKDFNPNGPLAGAGGPAAGEFKQGESQGGGSAGGGLGGAGGTSAARNEGGGGDGEKAGRSQAGGKYAASEESGGKFSRSGGGSGGAGVGIAGGFGDLLRKFLPGNEEKKDKPTLELQASDRTPASDQAAVMGRNKNIFIEISKRYQKKQSEGAVVFQ